MYLALVNRRRYAGLAAALRDERPKSSFPRKRESIFRHPGEGRDPIFRVSADCISECVGIAAWLRHLGPGLRRGDR